MAEGIQLRITHARRVLPSPPYTAGTVRTSSILIDDLREDEARRGLRLPAQYIPYAMPGGAPGYIDLTYTSLVARSFEQGDIRGLINAGEVTVQFFIGTAIRQGWARNRVEALVTPYDVGVDEDTILVNPAVAAPFVVNLPPGATHGTGVITVKDKKPMATLNNIQVVAAPGETIDGNPAALLTLDYTALTLEFSGTEWSLV